VTLYQHRRDTVSMQHSRSWALSLVKLTITEKDTATATQFRAAQPSDSRTEINFPVSWDRGAMPTVGSEI